MKKKISCLVGILFLVTFRAQGAEYHWQGVSLEQRAELVPPKDFAKPGGTAHNYQMREYFREQVWPELREKALGNNP